MVRSSRGCSQALSRRARRDNHHPWWQAFAMAIRKVARLGHPILRKPTRELSVEEIRSEEMRRLVVDMIDTMHEYGGVGLAAPQVHEPIRLAVIEVDQLNPRYQPA